MVPAATPHLHFMLASQYAKVQDHQCLPKPPHLTWEEAAAYMLVAATAYRMLHGWPPNAVKPGDPTIIGYYTIASGAVSFDTAPEKSPRTLNTFHNVCKMPRVSQESDHVLLYGRVDVVILNVFRKV